MTRRAAARWGYFAVSVGLLVLLGVAFGDSSRAAPATAHQTDDSRDETSAIAEDPGELPPVDYSRQIRPILSDVCYKCHGPDEETRQTSFRLDVKDSALGEADSGGKVIIPGDCSESVLIQRITSDDPSLRMPPADSGKNLTPEQIELLKRWVAEGAAWKEHWAFIKPERPQLPAVAHKAWPRNPIDYFVLAQLEQAGMTPEKKADKETLIRRVTFDLTGLPPTPAEIDAFLADDSPDAYERLVDRLLESPYYGEQQTRYWLDAARYGDTHGLHLDNERSIWPYRDWLIESFNRNQPFDQFTVEQLAGDLLPKPTQDQLIATGFNRCNVSTSEGGSIDDEYIVRYAVDRVETTSTVFMGLTVGCAVCHDHKFDPIAQREFYGLYAFFNSQTEKAMDGNALLPPPSIKTPDERAAARLQEFDQQIASLNERLDAPLPEVDAAQETWQTQLATSAAAQWITAEPVAATSTGGSTLQKQEDGSILATGKNPDKDTYELILPAAESPITAIRLEALLDKSLNKLGPGRADNGNFVLSELEVAILSPSNVSEAADPMESSVSLVSAAADFSQADGGYLIEKAIDGVFDQGTNGWAVAGHERHEARSAIFVPSAPIQLEPSQQLRIRLRHESQFTKHAIGRFRLSLSTAPEFGTAKASPWNMLGPILAGSDAEAYQTVYAPEQGVDLKAEVNGQTWAERTDFVDGQVHYLSGELAATYLFRTIDTPSPRKLTLALGSDDGIKVWVNGMLVHENFIKRSAGPDQDKIVINLREGRNEVLLKIVNFGGGYGFYYKPEREIIGEESLVLGPILSTPAEKRAPAQVKQLRDYYRQNYSPEWSALQSQLTQLKTSRQEFFAKVPSSMVMQEMEEPRVAHILNRGQYDQPGAEVKRGTPAVLPPLTPAHETPDRLDLARWLVDPNHPLTARVTVNRFWQNYFGTGIVKTAEDFGSQGEWPSHPELLDWLATEFLSSGWDVKHMQRLIVTSAAYRQASLVAPEKLAADPQNRLISRGPRFRLDAEAIRDTALAASGLLVRRLGGASVKPYQPAGIWEAVGYTDSNTARFQRDTGLDLYRRSMYTFWKRTAPPPSMLSFDAPSRESCTVRRSRTNTPLQALCLLNDEQFVEAARKFAERIMHEGGEAPEARIDFAFRVVTGRHPAADELAILKNAFAENLAHFQENRAAAGELLQVGESPHDTEVDQAELASWTMVANILLNLNETITKG